MRNTTILWAIAVLTAAVLSAGLTAQVVQRQFDQPRVLSGDDIGFRVEGQRRETRTDRLTGQKAPTTIVTGQLMVRVNGQWVEAELSGLRARPATN